MVVQEFWLQNVIPIMFSSFGIADATLQENMNVMQITTDDQVMKNVSFFQIKKKRIF